MARIDNDDDPEIQFSPLCGMVVWQGKTVDVQIYRPASPIEGWVLEVIDAEMTSTIWDDQFATDQEAFAAFYETLKTEGVEAFSLKATRQ